MSITASEYRTLAMAIIAFGLAAMLPQFASGHVLSLSVTMVQYAALCTAWTLFSGPTRYISLATAAFFGIGNYMVGLGIDTIPYPALVALAAVGGAVLAALVGLATLRLSGVYFVIFTLGLAELVRQVVTWWQTNFTTKVGLYVFTDLREQHVYWMLLGLTAAVFLTGWLINRSRLGFAMRIIGNDETVASHVGINTAGAKVLLFMISGAFIGIAGALLAPRYAYVQPPSAFNPMISFQVVIMALLGGTRRLWGPLVGVVPYILLIDFVTAEFPDYTNIVVGVAFIAIVFLLPDGVLGRIEQGVRATRARAGPGADARKEPAQ